MIRENLDLGRSDQASLIYKRRVNRRAPGPFRMRVTTVGITPHGYRRSQKMAVIWPAPSLN